MTTLSQIVAAVTAPASTDVVVGVRGGTTDQLWTFSQVFGLTQIPIHFPAADPLYLGLGSGILVQNTNLWGLSIASTGPGNDATLNFSATSAATLASNNAISASSPIATISAFADYGAGYAQTSAIKFSVDGALPGGASVPGLIEFYTMASGATSPSRRVIINNSGFLGINVGIGLVGNSTNSQLQIAADGNLNNVLNLIGYNSTTIGLSLRYDLTGNASPAGQTLVGTNAAICQQRFRGSDGVAMRTAAIIEVDADGTPAANSMPGRIMLSTTPSGTTTALERVRTDAAGNVVANMQGAVATNAQNGFFYIASCAGQPTGTPTAYTGDVPMVYDTTNHKFWIYDTAAVAWRGVVLT